MNRIPDPIQQHVRLVGAADARSAIDTFYQHLIIDPLAHSRRVSRGAIFGLAAVHLSGIDFGSPRTGLESPPSPKCVYKATA